MSFRPATEFVGLATSITRKLTISRFPCAAKFTVFFPWCFYVLSDSLRNVISELGSQGHSRTSESPQFLTVDRLTFHNLVFPSNLLHGLDAPSRLTHGAKFTVERSAENPGLEQFLQHEPWFQTQCRQ